MKYENEALMEFRCHPGIYVKRLLSTSPQGREAEKERERKREETI
jgi:hypothetical protein